MKAVKRNDGTLKQPPKRKTNKTRDKGTTELIRSTEYVDAFDAREIQLKKRRSQNGS